MRQFTFDRQRLIRDPRYLSASLGVTYQLVDGDRERSWDDFATRLIDALTHWCQASGIRLFGMGHTQIALQVTFADARDAMMFKLRWWNA